MNPLTVDQVRARLLQALDIFNSNLRARLSNPEFLDDRFLSEVDKENGYRSDLEQLLDPICETAFEIVQLNRLQRKSTGTQPLALGPRGTPAEVEFEEERARRFPYSGNRIGM